jgi:Zinc knuckle
MNLKLDSQISYKMPQDNLKPNTTQKDVHFQDKISQPQDITCHVTVSQAPRDGAQAPQSGNMANAHITCFSCGAKGHYASDIKCPNYGNTSISQCEKPQL